MNIKIRIANLLIFTTLALGVFSVASTSTGTLTMAARDASITNATAPQQTTITITAPTQVKGNESIYVNGTLTANVNGIANAEVHLQWLDPTTGNWTDVFDGKTGESGQFSLPVFMYFPAQYTFRVAYDGDSSYAPAVSNEIMVTVTK